MKGLSVDFKENSMNSKKLNQRHYSLYHGGIIHTMSVTFEKAGYSRREDTFYPMRRKTWPFKADMRKFAEAYPDFEIVQQVAALIPWDHTEKGKPLP